jgi:hypothetical protein
MGEKDRGASAGNEAVQSRPEVLMLTSLQADVCWRGSAGSSSGVVQLTVDTMAKDADPSRKG